MRCIFIVLVASLFYSCQSQHAQKLPLVFQGNQMTMDYRIQVGHSLTTSDIKKINSVISKTFQEINQSCNKWNPESEISILNQLEAGEKRIISDQLYEVLTLADQAFHLTQGKFDPSIEPIQKLWKTFLDKNTFPSEQQIQTILPAIGWKLFHFDQKIFWKEHSLSALDLGGIAKGYCIDLLTDRIKDLGFQNLLVEWGGEIKASGKHPDNRPWTIFISRLKDHHPENAIDTIALKNQAIATSGDYLQYWVLNKGGQYITYSHIFDAKTGFPLERKQNSIASASVLSSSCALADGLATAAMLFSSSEEAMNWSNQLTKNDSNLQFWIVSREYD